MIFLGDLNLKLSFTTDLNVTFPAFFFQDADPWDSGGDPWMQAIKGKGAGDP